MEMRTSDERQDRSRSTSPNTARSRVILSENDVLEIYRVKITNQSKEFKQRITAASVARKFGVGIQVIRNIWNGRTWIEETRLLREQNVPTTPLSPSDCGAASEWKIYQPDLEEPQSGSSSEFGLEVGIGFNIAEPDLTTRISYNSNMSSESQDYYDQGVFACDASKDSALMPGEDFGSLEDYMTPY